jgi:hypothetical protein
MPKPTAAVQRYITIPLTDPNAVFSAPAYWILILRATLGRMPKPTTAVQRYITIPLTDPNAVFWAIRGANQPTVSSKMISVFIAIPFLTGFEFMAGT